MEFGNSKTIGSSPVNSTLEIKIKDFRTASESSTDPEYMGCSDQDFAVWFSASAFPNGYDEATEGWLVVLTYVTVRGKFRPQNSVVSWMVSVIDIEGNSRFPRSFTQDLSKKYYDDSKYLERSFVLNRADELLPEGVLTLRCDIRFEWYNVAPAVFQNMYCALAERFIPFISKHGPELVKYDPETGDPIDPSTYVDMKNKILHSVHLSESGQLYDIYGASHLSSDSESVKTRDSRVWIFETCTDSFNLLIDEHVDNLGTRLFKASSFFRRCANAPMKEQREKRIELSNVTSETFRTVSYFVMKETLLKLEFDELLEVYKFSHLYEMEELRRKSAQDMMELESDFKELQKIADFYSDEYLSELLYIRRHENENLERDLPHLRMEDKPYSDCYI